MKKSILLPTTDSILTTPNIDHIVTRALVKYTIYEYKVGYCYYRFQSKTEVRFYLHDFKLR